MAAGRPQPTVARYGVRITTVDPSQGLVEGVFKGDAQARRLSVYTTPSSFRWPAVGEDWMVRQENGSWYLEGLWPQSTFQDVDPGDLVLNAPTGIVHVLGSADGSTDFSFDATHFPIGPPGTPILTVGPALGTAPPVPTLQGTDRGGRILFGTGATTTIGVLLTVTLIHSLTHPAISLTPVQDVTHQLGLSVNPLGATTLTGFQIICHTAPAAAQSASTYSVYFLVHPTDS